MNKHTFWYLICFIFINIVHVGITRSEDTRYDYPELLVTPSASERLSMEAAQESKNSMSKHLPIQASALATLLAGAIQFGHTAPDHSKGAAIAGVSVGSAWLASTLFLSLRYRPYQRGLEDTGKLPTQTPKQRLTRERLAEEALEAPARLANRLTWLSVITNFGTNVYLLTQAEKKSLSIGMDIIGLVAAFTPLIFRYSWETVACDQEQYKKKIYGPIAQATFFTDQNSGSVAPGILVGFHF